jgi:hypothetical protein
MKKHILILVLVVLVVLSFSFQNSSISWVELETGLQYALIDAPVKSTLADSKIDVLKINPRYFKFQLLSAGEKKTDAKTAKQWCESYKVIAGINASMFKLENDFKQSTGYMKNYAYVNNSILNGSYKNIFAFNAKDSSSPAAHIIDISCEDWNTLKNKYNSFSQSIRMLDCSAQNTWQQQQKKWSMILLGEDTEGNILFIFTRSPYQVYAFINILSSLDLKLKRLMYLEGGPESSFYLNHPKMNVEKFGSYETGFNENDTNQQYWAIPNMIAITRK